LGISAFWLLLFGIPLLGKFGESRQKKFGAGFEFELIEVKSTSPHHFWNFVFAPRFFLKIPGLAPKSADIRLGRDSPFFQFRPHSVRLYLFLFEAMNCANGEISPRSVQNDHFYRKWTKTKNISQTVMYRRFWGVPSFDGIPSILMYDRSGDLGGNRMIHFTFLV
jgi:hypothetical protein